MEGRPKGWRRCVSTTKSQSVRQTPQPPYMVAHVRPGRNDFVVIDVETTGLAAHRRIIEVALLALTPTGQLVDQFVSLVNPGGRVGATEIHGLSEVDLADAPPFDQVASAIVRQLEGRIPVAHHAAFDWSTLTSEFARLGVPLSQFGVHCTSRLAATALCCRGHSRRISLTDACRQFEIPHVRPHTALGDATATADLFFTLCNVVDVPHLRPVARVSAGWRLGPVIAGHLRADASPAPTPEHRNGR